MRTVFNFGELTLAVFAAIMGSALWIAVGGLIALLLRSRLSVRKRNLANVCIVYIGMLGCFGHLYHYLYINDHSRFAFASDVLSTRRLEIAVARKNEINKLEKLIISVTQLSAQLGDGRAVVHLPGIDDSLIEIQSSDYHFDFNFDASWSGSRQGKLFRGARVGISDKSGMPVGSEYVEIIGPDVSLQKTLTEKQWNAIADSYFPPKTPGKFRGMLEPLVGRLETSLNALEAAGKDENGPRQEEWTYLDFLYFSTITQTTVGYGDILPNSSTVRVCVIMQVLIGLLLLGVAISWVTSDEVGS